MAPGHVSLFQFADRRGRSVHCPDWRTNNGSIVAVRLRFRRGEMEVVGRRHCLCFAGAIDSGRYKVLVAEMDKTIVSVRACDGKSPLENAVRRARQGIQRFHANGG